MSSLPPTHDNANGPPSSEQPSTPHASGSPSPPQPPSTQPFFATDVYPHVIQRVSLPPAAELKHVDGRTVIRLTGSKNGFLGSTSVPRFFNTEIKKRGNDFWPTWSSVPDDVKELWWKTFKGQFYWGPHTDAWGRDWHGEEDGAVRRVWMRMGFVRYGDICYKAKEAWKNGEGPGWMTEQVLAQFIERWTNPEFVNRVVIDVSDPS